MSEITRTQLLNASLDATSLEEIINGAASPGTVTTRLGAVVKTLSKIMSDVESSAVTDKFNFDSSTTMADPGTGDLRFNNATLASATALAISALSAISGNPNVRAWIASWDDSLNAVRGTITIRKASAPATFAIFNVTNVLTDNTTWLQLVVTYVAGSGTFSNGDSLYISFNRAGVAGTGDMNGPSSSTDNAIPRFDGTTGKLLQGSGVTITDSNDIVCPAWIDCTRLRLTSSTYLTPVSTGIGMYCSGVNTAFFGDSGWSLGIPVTNSSSFTGTSFNASGGLVYQYGTSIETKYIETDAAADEKNWRQTINAGTLTFETLNDAYSATSNIWILDRVGNTVPVFKVTPQIQDVNNKPILPVQSIKIEETKTTGTAGGTSVAATWTQRPFSSLAYNNIPGASIPTSNQISLPAGTYEIDAWSIFGSANLSTGKGICRFYNVTDAAVLGYTSSGVAVANTSGINVITQIEKFKITLAATKTIEMQYYVDTAMVTNGLGYPVNMGSAVERYAEFTVTKIA